MTLAVLDTNVFVSAFLQPTGLPGRLLEWAEAGRFEVISVMATDKLRHSRRAAHVISCGHVR